MIKSQSITKSLSPAKRGALFYLAHWGAVGIFLPFLNVYFVELGLSGRQIGWLSALIPLMALLSGPTLAALADRRRWRVRMLQVACGSVAVSFFFLGFPKTFTGLIPLVLLYAFVRSPILALADSLIARMATRHTLNYGNLRMWGDLGSFWLPPHVCHGQPGLYSYRLAGWSIRRGRAISATRDSTIARVTPGCGAHGYPHFNLAGGCSFGRGRHLRRELHGLPGRQPLRGWVCWCWSWPSSPASSILGRFRTVDKLTGWATMRPSI